MVFTSAVGPKNPARRSPSIVSQVCIHRRSSTAIFAILIVGLTNSARGDSDPRDGFVSDDFVSEVAPILARNCVGCHNSADHKGDFSLQTGAELRDSGQIEPGNPDASPLLEAILSSEGKPPAMPKNKPPLTADDTTIIRHWIAAGAPWPEGYVLAPHELIDLNWWSLKPLLPLSPPEISKDSVDSAWPQSPIDPFILARLHENGLRPAPPADRRVLIRRLYFDLTGLPPTRPEIEAFVTDPDPDAYVQLVDRLLASPHHGEHWARHWLDVVHYADTHGYDKDKPRPNAWPYRDYVIQAFNQDLPYSQFVREQIAGDVRWPDRWDAVRATGFLAAGPWDFIGHEEVVETKVDGMIARNLDRDDIVSTTLNSFCSLTVQCARCHDHKLDPVSMREYYGLQAVFAALDRADRTFDPDPKVAARRRTLWDLQDQLQERQVSLEKRIAEQESARAAATQSDSSDSASPAPAVASAQMALEKEQLQQQIKSTAEELESLPAPCRIYAGTVHRGAGAFRGRFGLGPREIHILGRGDVTRPGDIVLPGAAAISPDVPANFDLASESGEGERRIALANWIVHRQNPLTWRSIVNRVWQYHFDRGLVDSANDFGRGGQLPSHPELLDWLALDFRDHGQSLKRLHRLICTSAVYQQASQSSTSQHLAAESIDQDNRLLWRMNRRRLTAEEVRDAALLVSGRLNLKAGGPGFADFVVERPEHSPHYEYDQSNPDDPSTHRRTIYRFVVRSQPQPFLTTLDCADPSLSVPRRSETQTALQALAMLNNAFVLSQAEAMAAVLESDNATTQACIEDGFERVTGRTPTPEETALLLTQAQRSGLTIVCHAFLNLSEFVFVD